MVHAGFFCWKANPFLMSSRATALRIAVAAMFVALSLIASVLPTIPGSALKFGGFPLLLAGMLVGPRTGFSIGCLTDILGFALRPVGMFFPGFTLTQGLTAAIPGLLMRNRDPLTGARTQADLEPEKPILENRPLGAFAFLTSYLRLLVVFGLTQLVTSVLMVSFFTSKIVLGTPLGLEIGQRLLIQSVHVPVYALLAVMVLRALSETELYQRLIKARK